MFAVRKNQIVVTTLVVMIAVAGYLNFSQTQEVQSTAAGSKTATESTAQKDDGTSYEALIDDSADITVLADDVEKEETAQSTTLDPLTAEANYTSPDDDTGAAIFVNATEDTSTYFVQAKLDREQSRAKQKDMLTEMINNEKLDSNQKADFAAGMLELQQRIEKETAAETMIKAKGFNEAYVRIDDETVDVVVSSENLSDSQLAQIEDIVKRKTGVSADKIRISTLKKQG
ncbi:MAG: SpoIIIAH-like family protein [Lachnospiraceae bacterium]|nr:SpoIIIAH-like family protein [Lachnospiraceae bacterium]